MKTLPNYCPIVGSALIAGIVGIGGCSDPKVHHDLSGEITLDGQPVSGGQIYFSANKEQGNDGPSLNVTIENGRYSTLASGRTAPVGPSRVRIEMLVDGALYTYETTADLPPSPGTKDFAVTKAETKRVQALGAPSMGGGGKGMARERSKRQSDESSSKGDPGAKDGTTPKEGK